MSELKETNCIFCDICNKKARADGEEILYEDEEMIIVKDIKPSAKHHYLCIPKKHIKTVKDLKQSDCDLLEKLIRAGKETLTSNGGDLNDLQLGFHWPPFYSIPHIHLHVLSPYSEMGLYAKLSFRPGTMWFVNVDYVFNYIKNRL